MNTSDSVKKLRWYVRGFRGFKVSDSTGRSYFGFGFPVFCYIAGSGHVFEESDKPKELIVKGRSIMKYRRPSLYDAMDNHMPDGFRLIASLECDTLNDNSVKHSYVRFADDAPLDHVLSVYEAAYTAAPLWVKALVTVRSVTGRLF